MPLTVLMTRGNDGNSLIDDNIGPVLKPAHNYELTHFMTPLVSARRKAASLRNAGVTLRFAKIGPYIDEMK